MFVSASKLYDFLVCPHRVWRDVYGPQDEKIKETNPFVQLLWDKGTTHEKKVIQRIGAFQDISQGSLEDRFKQTIEAMQSGATLIYQGVLMDENLVGIPDLLRKEKNGSYLPIDIKSGAAFAGVDEEEGEEGKPKKHYAVQLCLYSELLNRLGFSQGMQGSVIDVYNNEVSYPLMEKMGPRTPQTYWALYEEVKKEVMALLANQIQNKPAMMGSCKLCPWVYSCKKWCEEKNDLSKIFYVGRSVRDKINEELKIETVIEFEKIDVPTILEQKKKDKNFLKGLAEKTLNKYKNRANILLVTRQPVFYKKIEFPQVPIELFFDIEDDPTQDFVYMHGFYERSSKGERYFDFTTKEFSGEAERETWQSVWNYIHSLPSGQFSIYYYSPHEKTTYRRLQKRYPEVVSPDQLETFFESPNVIDLYNKVIQSHTDWPLGSYSLKEIATYLGFSWRDATPSGALSIQWFNEFLKTKDPTIMKRIREYNEDDCKATMILKDGVESLLKTMKTFRYGIADGGS